MAVYTIQAPDGRKIKVEAADEATALRGAQEWAAANPKQPQSGMAYPPPGLKPGSKEYAIWARDQALAGNKLPQISPTPLPPQQAEPNTDIGSKLFAGAGSFIEGVPIAGPTLLDWAKQGRAAVQGMTPEQVTEEFDTAKAANPISSAIGNIGGSVATLLPLGATALGGRLLGTTGSFGQRLIAGVGSGAALSGADTLARGGDVNDMITNAGIGAGLGALFPIGGAVARAVGNKVQPIVGALTNPIREAYRRTGSAVGRDMAANPGSVLNATDEAVASTTGVPLINADRGGETTRALVRSVANQSPEARGVIEKVASDRFSGQAGRAVDFVRRLAGGSVDDLTYQQNLTDAARLTNKPRYDAAFNAPGADEVWSRELWELMQSDTFRAAVNAAESRGTDKAAISGFKAVKNPFVQGADGSISFRTNADGSTAVPSLAFWDQVKRNLDGMIGTAKRSGDNALATDLTQMKQKMVGALDALVPEYQSARAGAAAYFGAEDALEAGKTFANATRQLPEARRAFAALNDAEKRAFRTGFASEIIDKIKDARFRANVIDQAFGSPAKREMIELVFGEAKAKQLEAYIRVEDLADKLRGALGNSTTARQLMELGIGAGAGTLLSGGDWKGAIGGAALVRGGRWITQRADAKVMQEIGKLLTSSDPADLQKAVYNAALSPKWMEALQGIESLFPPAVVPLEATRAREPISITVRGGANSVAAQP